MASIVTNIAANSAFRNVQVSSAGLDKQIAKLSSGFRINRSGDDAAGLAIANKLRAEVRSLQQASRNAAQGISMLQIADGAVNTISGILDRMKELASAANSASIGTESAKLDAEFQALKAEIGRIAATTQYHMRSPASVKMPNLNERWTAPKIPSRFSKSKNDTSCRFSTTSWKNSLVESSETMPEGRICPTLPRLLTSERAASAKRATIGRRSRR